MPDEPPTSTSPLYAMGQLQRAIDSLAAAQTPDERARLASKVSRWRSVLQGMADGTLAVGSRTPVRDTPAWVTLDVTHGGFASGSYLAELPPRTEELAVVAGQGHDVPGSTDRERVNLWYLTDAGLASLRQAQAQGSCRVELPEDAALPVVAWLLDHGHYESALNLVSELRPWMHRLRFAALPGPPVPPPVTPPGALVRVRTAGQVAATLRGRQAQPQVAAMTETLRVWLPLFDRLVSLWCDTVEGEVPRLTPLPRGGAAVTGGWPCRRWPADWAERRSAWLSDYAAAARNHGLAGQHRAPKSNFSRLRSALERCDTGSASLTGRDVGWIRRALANTVTRHGEPGSDARTAVRVTQAHIASQPVHSHLADILADRLDGYPASGGIPAVETIAGDVLPDESATVPPGNPMPAYLVGKAARALEAPAQELIERGIISSADVLATVLPQITAEVIAAGFGDPDLRTLHAQAYAAFRRRRSLLLLNLEQQVRFGELPWIAAIQPYATNSAGARLAARTTLEQVTLLALRGFPHAILPNPLVAEMTALARQADLAVPLVEEVAADIFTGTFTDKWRQAGAVASGSLAGTLYARYYDLPVPGSWALSAATTAERESRRRGRKTADGFAALCATRAAEAQPRADASGTGVSRVSVNGAILEQAQILTTHNLAALVDVLDLREQMTALAPELADRAFAWVLSRLARPADSWHSGLLAVKNAASAWRQGIYYLSLCDPIAQKQAVVRLRGQLRTMDGDLRGRFAPAVEGLDYVLAGGHFDASGLAQGPSAGKRFLGWTTAPHWVLGQRAPIVTVPNPFSNLSLICCRSTVARVRVGSLAVQASEGMNGGSAASPGHGS